MQIEDVTGDVEVWPENMEAIVVFLDLGTQWRHGERGITGLDYGAIFVPLRIRRVPRDRWADVFEGIRTMERAVLDMKADSDG